MTKVILLTGPRVSSEHAGLACLVFVLIRSFRGS